MMEHARNPLRASIVEQIALPTDTLAVWLRIGRAERIAVASSVPLGAVASVVRHLHSHASADLAEALGIVTCVGRDCPTALDWLTVEDQPTAATSA